MSINCIALGKRICFYRLKFNITQEKLAALTNCSREYIAYLESGTKTPSLPTLIDLANVLQMAFDCTIHLTRLYFTKLRHENQAAAYIFLKFQKIFLSVFPYSAAGNPTVRCPLAGTIHIR